MNKGRFGLGVSFAPSVCFPAKLLQTEQQKEAATVSAIVTLTENRDFRRLYGKGKCFVAPVLVTYAAKNREHITRIGITTGKKIGIAVQRSRARRVIREAYRSLMDQVKPGYDLVFVARGLTSRVKMQEVAVTMGEQLRKAGVLR